MSNACPICKEPTRLKYPGNDPENGPARPYCKNGHSTCYRCAGFFQAIVQVEGWTDEEFGVFPPSTHESDLCTSCDEEHRKDHCSCGSDAHHWHEGYGCCGSSFCCQDLEVPDGGP